MTQLNYQYVAIDRQGVRTRGTIQAGSRNEAFRRVLATGVQPIEVTTTTSLSIKRQRVNLKDISHFTYQFAVLMEARIPIVDGLRSIAEQETKASLRSIIFDVARQIEAGKTVTESIMQHRQAFGDIYVETIRAAETTGNMIAVLNSLAEMLDRRYELNKNVKGAMMYPIVVISALLLAVTFLMIFVVPRFARMFSSRGVELPIPTQILIAVSSFVHSWWPIILGGIIALFVFFRWGWNQPIWRARIDNSLHRVPYLREVLRGLAISRFTQVFGLSIRSGISLIDSLKMAGNASGRPLLQADAEKMCAQVNRGGRLSDVMRNCLYLPPFARRMLTAGEEAADMSKMCAVITRHYDREVTHLTKNVTTVIEPIMIVGLAGIVLIVALAIFLPMWNMATLIQ
ncbi:MAG TPA: type II secretion system F family protein [Phycisphaerales bacterium]|nr:type II secretion system F family protein [Phycisphaerales bacterium]